MTEEKKIKLDTIETVFTPYDFESIKLYLETLKGIFEKANIYPQFKKGISWEITEIDQLTEKIDKTIKQTME